MSFNWARGTTPVIPTMFAGVADTFCGLKGTLEFFYLFLGVLFIGHFLVANYGRQHWLGHLLVHNWWLVCVNVLGLVVLHSMHLPWLALGLIVWQLGWVAAWRKCSFDKVLWA